MKLEVFYSLQGEGPEIGKPAIFVRFFGCNMRCMFQNGEICDTAYTSWDLDYKKDGVFDYIEAKSEISRLLSKYKNINKIVFTGGEPFLYADKIMDIIEYVKTIRTKRITFDVETNGTMYNNNIRELVHYLSHIIISPKLENTIPDKQHKKERQLHLSSMKLYETTIPLWKTYIKVQFKFVVHNKEGIELVEDFVKKYEIPQLKIYLMPTGATRKELLKNYKFVFDECINHTWKFSSRLHIIAYDKIRLK